MAPIRALFSALLLVGTSWARNIPQSGAELGKRDQVSDCKSVLIALKASSFCSSFVPITDITTTKTGTAPTTTTTLIITAPPCTTTVATTTATNLVTTTSTAVTVTVVTVTSVPNKRALATSPAAVAARAASPACSIKGVPVQLNLYACDTIKKACLAFVTAKTVTRTATITPTSTVTTTTRAPCTSVTLTVTTTSTATVTTTTTSTSTTIVAAPTPTCNGQYVTSNTGTRFCQFFAGHQVRNSFQFYTTQFYDSSVSDADAIQNCANFVSSSGSGVAQTFQVFFAPSEDRWHCDTSLTSNCDSNFQPDSFVNQIYQYNVVGSVCGT